jgi:plasmid maintenance system antidote protein VapI
MDRSRMTRKPTTPGEILQHEYLTPLAQKAVDLHAARARLRRLPKPLVAANRFAS